jgi:Fe-S cluster assembly protein SufD
VSSQVKTRRGLATDVSRRAVEGLSSLKDEPEWMRERRLEAWREYEETLAPTGKEEEWRLTDPARLNMESALVYGESEVRGRSPDDWPRALRARLLGRDAKAKNGRGGLVIQHNSEPLVESLKAELADQGVVFSSLERALREHPELVQPYFMADPVSPPDGKFAALHAALWSGGTFLYVPKDVDVRLPLWAEVVVNAPGLSVFPHTLVIAERGSRVTLIEEHSSPDQSKTAFSNGLVEVHARDGAQVRYVSLQRWGGHVRSLNLLRKFLERDSRAESLIVGLGSELTKGRVEAVLRGEGAESQMLGLFVPTQNQHFDYVTHQDHVAPHTTSDLLFKSAVKDRGRSLYYGVTQVRKSARESSAYQESRNILLSEGAKADATPVLEIEAFDVLRCGHGATVGPVDEEQLFYLMCRGVPRAEAERMIVAGFFQQVLGRLGEGPLADYVGQALERKLNGRRQR